MILSERGDLDDWITEFSMKVYILLCVDLFEHVLLISLTRNSAVVPRPLSLSIFLTCTVTTLCNATIRFQ